jgi:hypothetical protein
VRDDRDRVLLCQLTYKDDWDLPDKMFTWSRPIKGFELSPSDGTVRFLIVEFA